jgi:hypothetical protein
MFIIFLIFFFKEWIQARGGGRGTKRQTGPGTTIYKVDQTLWNVESNKEATHKNFEKSRKTMEI